MTTRSQELYNLMLSKGYPEDFCREMTTKYLNTDYTATRMIGYLYHWEHPRMEDVVDEMLAILSDRKQFIEKHLSEEANANITRLYNEGLHTEEEE